MYAMCWDRKQETHYSTMNVLTLVYSITSPQVNPWFNNNFNFMEEYTNTWGLKDFCILMTWVTVGHLPAPSADLFCATALVLPGENKQMLSNLLIKRVAVITNGVRRPHVSAEALSSSVTTAGIFWWLFIHPGKRDGSISSQNQGVIEQR